MRKSDYIDVKLIELQLKIKPIKAIEINKLIGILLIAIEFEKMKIRLDLITLSALFTPAPFTPALIMPQLNFVPL